VLVKELKTHAVLLLQAKKMAGRAVLMSGSTATFKADTVPLVNLFHTAISCWLIHPPVGAGKEDGGPGHPHGGSALLVDVFHTAISYWLIHPPVGAGKEDGGPGHPHGGSALLVNVFHTAISYWLIIPPVGAGKEDGGPGHPHGGSARHRQDSHCPRHCP
jgi:hypothetical protein